MKRRAFTLIELLVVLAIIATLVALLFPVLVSARAKARQDACISNLHQIGMAIFLYSQDYDDLFPWGGSPVDLHTNFWQFNLGGRYFAQAQQLNPVQNVLQPYTHNVRIWDCPSDAGFDLGAWGAPGLTAHPSSFAQYGTSYYYASDWAILHQNIATVHARSINPPFEERGPADLFLMIDGSGRWHGQDDFEGLRINSLLCDGHVKSMGFDQAVTTLDIDPTQ